MKKIAVVLLFLDFFISVSAQKATVKVYAYKQQTVSGIREEIVNDREPNQPKSSPFPATYYVYAEVPKGSRFAVSGLLIDGNYYKAMAKKVKTPVYINDAAVPRADKDKEVLVKKTANDVYSISLKDQCVMPEGIAKQGIIENNAALLFVKGAGKETAIPVRSIRAVAAKQAM